MPNGPIYWPVTRFADPESVRLALLLRWWWEVNVRVQARAEKEEGA